MCVERVNVTEAYHIRQKRLKGVSPKNQTDPKLKNPLCTPLISVLCVVCTFFRASETYCTARSLFQAIRSHLHFSQLSAWLNATHGMQPQSIGYRSVSVYYWATDAIELAAYYDRSICLPRCVLWPNGAR